MTWNWRKYDWPNFTYNLEKIKPFEDLFLKGEGIQLGAFKHLNDEDKNILMIDMLSDEAIKTSEIEGEFLNRDSVQSSIRRQFGLHTSNDKIPPAEQGIAEMMVDLYKHFSQSLTHDTLFLWHSMLFKNKSDLLTIGQYRTHLEPMQVVSGYVHKPKIHFQAPPSSMIPSEMNKFIEWFNCTAPGRGKQTLSPLCRAGIAHLYFVCIHPFEDGNGRIGRAICEKALAQSFNAPTLLALSLSIEKNKKHYYDALEQANKSNEITQWLIYFSKTILAAQIYTQNYIDFLIHKIKLYDRVGHQLNARQEKALNRVFREGPEGFKGGLSAQNYISITKASRPTATRDLHDLVKLNIFVKIGERRHTRYYLPFFTPKVV